MSAPRSFPMARRCPFAPPPEYEQMRAEAPLVPVTLPSRQVIWVVTRHEEARQVLSDPRISTAPTQPGFPRLSDDATDVQLSPGSFIDMDPPQHDVYRKMLISEFSVRRINALRPGIQQAADRFIDEMLAGGRPADLVEAYGLPLPSLVICQLLGVPYEDHDYFQSLTRTLIRSLSEPAADGRKAHSDLVTYLRELVDRVQHDPGDNVLGRLVTGPVAEGRLSLDEAAGMAMLLLGAGHETTANMIPLGVLMLQQHPDQLAQLRADPSLWPGAVEELLRYHSIVDWVAFDRMAIEDLELGGQHVRAGDGVFVLGASANRDERAFDDPDEFDIHRGARRHVAFGYGVHQCLGQNLARAELEIAYRTLFERVPTLDVAPGGRESTTPVSDLPFKYDAVIFGLNELPVTW